MSQVFLYTDGACQGNPGPGGWAAILIWNEKEKVVSGFSENTTNNKMEMTAIIEGMKVLKKSCNVKIITDSQYVMHGFTKNWISTWQKNNWKTSKKEPVKNQDLWMELYRLTKTHNTSWEWVKGHSGNAYNERCDAYAKKAIEEHIKLGTKAQHLGQATPA
jgi:ribonuclease HI